MGLISKPSTSQPMRFASSSGVPPPMNGSHTRLPAKSLALKKMSRSGFVPNSRAIVVYPATAPGTATARPHDKPDHSRPRPIERRTAYVEVYNNSGLTGLAGETSAVLQDTGWRVVTTDNWYGEIPASTVYYPQRLGAQARLLARDLGVTRLHPAVPPMSFDRITVILTGTP